MQIPQVNLETEESAFLDQSWLYNKQLQALQAADPNYRLPEDEDNSVRYLTDDELVEKKVEIYFKNEQFQVRLIVRINLCFQNNLLYSYPWLHLFLFLHLPVIDNLHECTDVS